MLVVQSVLNVMLTSYYCYLVHEYCINVWIAYWIGLLSVQFALIVDAVGASER